MFLQILCLVLTKIKLNMIISRTKVEVLFNEISKKLNMISAFPFNISSYIRDMITFDHLSYKTKYSLCKNILFYFMVLLKNGQKTAFHAFRMKILNIVFRSFPFPFLIFEFNCSKTNPWKLKVK